MKTGSSGKETALSVKGELMGTSMPTAIPKRRRNAPGKRESTGTEMVDVVKSSSSSNSTRKASSQHHHASHHHMTDEEREMMMSYESLDYDIVRNEVYRSEVLNASRSTQIWNNVRSWTTFALIGITTGLIGFVIDTLVEKLVEWKFETTIEHIEDHENPGEYSYGKGFAVLLSFALALALVSTTLVNFIEPVAAGSGIPEVKSYLNGTNIPRYLRVPTGLVKIFGVICSVSAGLIVGKEGPLIHVGSIIAANYATLPGLSRIFGGSTTNSRNFGTTDSNALVHGAAAGAEVLARRRAASCFRLKKRHHFGVWRSRGSRTWRQCCPRQRYGVCWRGEKSSRRTAALLRLGVRTTYPNFVCTSCPHFSSSG